MFIINSNSSSGSSDDSFISRTFGAASTSYAFFAKHGFYFACLRGLHFAAETWWTKKAVGN